MTEISSTFAAVNRITSVDDGIKGSGYRPDWAKNLSCCELIAYLISLNLLTGLPVANAFYRMGSRSGRVSSASSNLYTISEQYL